MVMEYIIEPRIFWWKNYSSVALVLVMLVMAEAYGFLGLILAPLVSAGIQIVFKYLLHPDTSYESPGITPAEEPALMASSLGSDWRKPGLLYRHTPDPSHRRY